MRSVIGFLLEVFEGLNLGDGLYCLLGEDQGSVDYVG